MDGVSFVALAGVVLAAAGFGLNARTGWFTTVDRRTTRGAPFSIEVSPHSFGSSVPFRTVRIRVREDANLNVQSVKARDGFHLVRRFGGIPLAQRIDDTPYAQQPEVQAFAHEDIWRHWTKQIVDGESVYEMWFYVRVPRKPRASFARRTRLRLIVTAEGLAGGRAGGRIALRSGPIPWTDQDVQFRTD